jgi:hypothetical protein
LERYIPPLSPDCSFFWMVVSKADRADKTFDFAAGIVAF